jgi:hypothetical protein
MDDTVMSDSDIINLFKKLNYRDAMKDAKAEPHITDSHKFKTLLKSLLGNNNELDKISTDNFEDIIKKEGNFCRLYVSTATGNMTDKLDPKLTSTVSGKSISLTVYQYINISNHNAKAPIVPMGKYLFTDTANDSWDNLLHTDSKGSIIDGTTNVTNNLENYYNIGRYTDPCPLPHGSGRDLSDRFQGLKKLPVDLSKYGLPDISCDLIKIDDRNADVTLTGGVLGKLKITYTVKLGAPPHDGSKTLKVNGNSTGISEYHKIWDGNKHKNEYFNTPPINDNNGILLILGKILGDALQVIALKEQFKKDEESSSITGSIGDPKPIKKKEGMAYTSDGPFFMRCLMTQVPCILKIPSTGSGDDKVGQHYVYDPNPSNELDRLLIICKTNISIAKVLDSNIVDIFNSDIFNSPNLYNINRNDLFSSRTIFKSDTNANIDNVFNLFIQHIKNGMAPGISDDRHFPGYLFKDFEDYFEIIKAILDLRKKQLGDYDLPERETSLYDSLLEINPNKIIIDIKNGRLKLLLIQKLADLDDEINTLITMYRESPILGELQENLGELQKIIDILNDSIGSFTRYLQNLIYTIKVKLRTNPRTVPLPINKNWIFIHDYPDPVHPTWGGVVDITKSYKGQSGGTISDMEINKQSGGTDEEMSFLELFKNTILDSNDDLNKYSEDKAKIYSNITRIVELTKKLIKSKKIIRAAPSIKKCETVLQENLRNIIEGYLNWEPLTLNVSVLNPRNPNTETDTRNAWEKARAARAEMEARMAVTLDTDTGMDVEPTPPETPALEAAKKANERASARREKAAEKARRKKAAWREKAAVARRGKAVEKAVEQAAEKARREKTAEMETWTAKQRQRTRSILQEKNRIAFGKTKRRRRRKPKKITLKCKPCKKVRVCNQKERKLKKKQNKTVKSMLKIKSKQKTKKTKAKKQKTEKNKKNQNISKFYDLLRPIKFIKRLKKKTPEQKNEIIINNLNRLNKTPKRKNMFGSLKKKINKNKQK